MSRHNAAKILSVTVLISLWQTKPEASLKQSYALALPVTALCVLLIVFSNWHMLITIHIYMLYLCTSCVIIQSIHMHNDQVKSTNTSISLNIYDFFLLRTFKFFIYSSLSKKDQLYAAILWFLLPDLNPQLPHSCLPCFLPYSNHHSVFWFTF